MGSGTSKSRKDSQTSGNAKTKSLIKTLSGHTGGINCMQISPSGGFLLTGSDDRTARVWDLMTYECKVVLEGHTGYISCCRIWKERFAVTGSVDKTVRKWNMLSGNCVLKMELHKGMINRLLLYGNYLFSSSYDRTAVCWDIVNGQAARVFRGHKQSILPLMYVKTAEHDPDGTEDIDRNRDALISGSMDCTAKIWSINSGTSLRTFRGHKGAILCLTIDKDKKYLYTGSTDFTIKKWNITNGTMMRSFKGHEGSVICLDISHKLLYSASVDSTARCWVAEFGDSTRKYVAHEHMISDMKFHDGLLITGSGDNTVRVFEAKSGTLKRTFKGHKYAVNCILPVDNVILSASYDGSVKIWNIRDLKRERVHSMNISDSYSSITSTSPATTDQRDMFPSDMETSSIVMTRHDDIHSNVNVEVGLSRNVMPNLAAYHMRNSQQGDVTFINESIEPPSRIRPAHVNRKNDKRRGVKAGNNKVAPVATHDEMRRNRNGNNNNEIADPADDIESLLDKELSGDSYSEGYTSRSSSSATFQCREETGYLYAVGEITRQISPKTGQSRSEESIKNSTPTEEKTRLNGSIYSRADVAEAVSSKSLSLNSTSSTISISLPSSSNSSRNSSSVHAKLNDVDSSATTRKQAKTDVHSTVAPWMSSADIALVDEEMQVIAAETDSTSTGYHSDKSVPQSPEDKSHPQLSNGTQSKYPALKNGLMKLTTKSSSRSSLWATCSNSVDANGNKIRPKRGLNPNKQLSSDSGKNIKRSGAVLTPSESERLENEILQMS